MKRRLRQYHHMILCLGLANQTNEFTVVTRDAGLYCSFLGLKRHPDVHVFSFQVTGVSLYRSKAHPKPILNVSTMKMDHVWSPIVQRNQALTSSM